MAAPAMARAAVAMRAVPALAAAAMFAMAGVALAFSPDERAADAAVRQWVRYPPVPARLSPQAELGRRLFFDTALSASKRMSCASCHSPQHAYGPPNGRAVQLGGRDLRRAGTRAVPSLRYLDGTPLFVLHAYTPGSEDAEYEGPTGGFDRDGRAATRRQQAAGPLLDPDEMANMGKAAVVAAVRSGAHAAAFARVYGAGALGDTERAFDDIGAALQAFQIEDASFHPYTSKFDAVMSGHARFTPRELRGYALFNNPGKGNCAACHIDATGPGGRPAAFTDYGYAALGVPRNPAIPANRDPRHYDMGLCGPYRRDLRAKAAYCGMFKTPTLRNVATRRVFFHNGYFRTLAGAVRFYVERDSGPHACNDLPRRLCGNIDRSDAPMDRGKGDKPALDALEIADIVAFLRTLDDGYSATAGEPALRRGAQRTGFASRSRSVP